MKHPNMSVEMAITSQVMGDWILPNKARLGKRSSRPIQRRIYNGPIKREMMVINSAIRMMGFRHFNEKVKMPDKGAGITDPHKENEVDDVDTPNHIIPHAGDNVTMGNLHDQGENAEQDQYGQENHQGPGFCARPVQLRGKFLQHQTGIIFFSFTHVLFLLLT